MVNDATRRAMIEPFLNKQPNRIAPAMGPQAYKTYQIAAPVSTHWRPATCEEVDCPNYQNGWKTVVDADGAAANYIRHDKSRNAREERPEGNVSVFTYGPGQNCFTEHRARVERSERFLVTGGDWRGNPRNERYEHVKPADWQEDMADHLDRLKTAHERG